MITLEVNGTRYQQMLAVDVSFSLEAVAREFSAVLAQPAAKPLPFKGGEACRVLVDGEVVLTGYIECVSVSYGVDQHEVTVQGRSKAGDLVDSTLEALTLNPPLSLQRAVERVLAQVGVGLTVTTEATGVAEFTKAEDLLSPGIGDGGFEYIERLARKRQVLVTSDAAGNLRLVRGEGTRVPVSLRNVYGAEDNNILSASVSYDHTGRFRDYVVKSQEAGAASIFSTTVSNKATANRGGEAADTAIREGRRLVLQAEEASSDAAAKARATWEADIRRSRSQRYTATVQGFRPKGGALWDIKTLVEVRDSFAGLDEELLVAAVAFSYSTGGSFTTLTLLPKNAFTLAVSEPERPKSDAGNPFLA